MFIFGCVISIIVITLQTMNSGAKKSSSEFSCFPRDFGKSKRVCVCNATHCDTIRSLSSFPTRMFNVYLSDAEGSRFKFTKKNLASRINSKSVKIIVNSSESYQKILGFGGTMSDASLFNMVSLSENAKNNLLDSYFSENGIEYGLVRMSIGGNDFSNRTYTLAQVPGDSSLRYFALSQEDIALKIPYLQTIKKLGCKGVKILATAWTAPPWMKTNGDYKGFGVLKDEYYSLWSRYHLRFLEEYDKRGLRIWAVTTGHQPSSGLVPFYPHNCMGWTPFSQARWIAKNLGPDLQSSKFSATKILALDDSRFFLPWWPKWMFHNLKAKSFVSGIAIQWYWNYLFPPRLLDLTHAEFPEKFILSTEASFHKRKSSSEAVALGSWDRAEDYAESIIDDINHWTSGWMDSNLALDLKGGPNWAENFADAPVIVNISANEFYKQPMFYAIGHFSKFVPEGSFRIDVKVSKSGIKAAGFRTPQSNVVVVLVNKKTYDIPITIVGAKKGNANTLLPKKSIITVIYRHVKLQFHN